MRTQAEISNAVDVMIEMADDYLCQWLISRHKLTDAQLLEISKKKMSYNVKAELLRKYKVSQEVFDNLLEPKTKATQLIIAALQQEHIPLASKRKLITKDFMAEITKPRWGSSKSAYEKAINKFPPDVKELINNYTDVKDIIA